MRSETQTFRQLCGRCATVFARLGNIKVVENDKCEPCRVTADWKRYEAEKSQSEESRDTQGVK